MCVACEAMSQYSLTLKPVKVKISQFALSCPTLLWKGSAMQYYKPDAPQLWVGDCMPFYHAGLFHFYYLLDEGHHQALGGLGGHQWAHATSTDLVTWTHHPLALPITQAGEVSICTGSVFHHGDIFYAFHAVRRPDWTQRLGIATSPDGIHFTKLPPLLHAEPPDDYDPLHFRDPAVFQDPATGRFHMLVTSKLTTHWSCHCLCDLAIAGARAGA